MGYSTFRGRAGIYLEDLFVVPGARGVGAGKALLKRLAERCVEADLGRLEWSVLDWNTPSIEFYDSLGAMKKEGWTVRRLYGEALENLAKRHGAPRPKPCCKPRPRRRPRFAPPFVRPRGARLPGRNMSPGSLTCCPIRKSPTRYTTCLGRSRERAWPPMWPTTRRSGRRSRAILAVNLDDVGKVSGYSHFAIWPELASGELAGARRADLQNSGQGRQGVAHSVAWMFEVLGLRLIGLTAALDNFSSAKAIDGAGFKRMGEVESVRPDGTTRRSLYWELTRDEWRMRHRL